MKSRANMRLRLQGVIISFGKGTAGKEYNVWPSLPISLFYPYQLDGKVN